ncbi:N-methyl-L-tryptophan oxidase [Aeromicrobium panaciterrae]|uniref:FAD-dependent oxidoreductase n=1 Tax=Aeromicrobium panaciterrae TaxID=363861 RepID=UPI0031D5FD82
MPGHASVIVVGGGAMGTSIARELAERGHRVTVLEQFTAGHANGSSHGSSRIVRLTYDDPFYVRLAREARPLWDELQLLSDVPLFHQCGSVDHGPRAELEPFAAALAEVGVPYEWLTPAEAGARWPGLRFDESVLLQPDGGVANPDVALALLRRLAIAAGAEWLDGVRVDSVQGTSVVAGDRTWHADQVVVAAGVWTDALVGLAPEVATQVQPAHFTPVDDAHGWPTFLHRRGDGAPEAYGLPSPDGIKVGFHGGGKVVDLEKRDFSPVADELQQLRAYVTAWVPGVDVDSLDTTTCLYGALAEDDFLIDRAGDMTIAAGFSGHGFKFVPLVGRLVADLVAGTTTPEPRFTRLSHHST